MKPKKLDQSVLDLLNDRLKDELTAFYFYRAASNWCKNVGFFKAADFFSDESKSETEHAKKLEDFIVGWNCTPVLSDLDQPKLEFKNLYELICEAYNIEYSLYEKYEDTQAKVLKMGDTCVFDFLRFFSQVQTESVAEYSDKLNMLEGCDETDKFQLLMLEKKLF